MFASANTTGVVLVFLPVKINVASPKEFVTTWNASSRLVPAVAVVSWYGVTYVPLSLRILAEESLVFDPSISFKFSLNVTFNLAFCTGAPVVGSLYTTL